MDHPLRDPDPDNNRGDHDAPADRFEHSVQQAVQRAAQRASVARSLLTYTHDPEGVVSRSSATIENHDTASDTDHHAGRRRNLANNFNESNEAVESTLAIQGAAPSIRSPPSSETISVNRTWRADRTEDANRLEHANGHEHTGDTAPSDWTSAADVTPRFPRLIIADASADNRHTVRPLIPAFGSPSLRPRAPTDDGGRQALVNSLTGVAPRASSTTTLGGARRPSLARASSRGALANDSVPENGVFPGRADTSQAAGDVHISDNDIIADGPLPAAGDTPIVGTMPAIGRDAYITVQCPNGEFYTVRIDLTNAAPNVTYNISINIPPCPPPSPPSPP